MFYADPWDEAPRLERLLESELLHSRRFGHDHPRRFALSVVDRPTELARQSDVRRVSFDHHPDEEVVLNVR